jgi:zinc protease
MSLNRTAAPPIAELISDLSIHPEIRLTPSGSRLHIFENNIQPVVRVEFVFKAGKWYQPKAGVASLTAKMLKEGTSQHTAKQIADTIDYYGASLDVSHGFDRSSVTLYCLAKFLPSLLPLAFEIIQHPSFPDEEFALMKQRVIQTLAVDKQKNSYLSTELLTASIYGKDHPYSTIISEEEIQAVNIDDLVAFHKAAYPLFDTEVFITGDISSTNIKTIESGLPSYRATKQLLPSITSVSPQTDVIYKETANQMQASLRVGKPSLTPLHSDYPALYLLNHILGGYFGSRLMRNIREDKGFTYGIYSSISHKEQASLFSLGTDIKGDKIDETLGEISKEIATLQQELIPSDEFNTARKHLAGKFLSDHATIFDKMDKYKSNVLLGLPKEFQTQLIELFQSLTTEDLRIAAQNHLTADNLLKVIVGGHH